MFIWMMLEVCYYCAAVEAFHVCPSLDILIPALREGGVDGLEERISLMPGALFSAPLSTLQAAH